MSEATSRPTPSTVVVFGAHQFPDGNASANRMLALAQAWHEAGFPAMVLSDDPTRVVDEVLHGAVAGMPYLLLGHRAATRRQRARRRATLPARAIEALRSAGASAGQIIIPLTMYTPQFVRQVRRLSPDTEIIVDVVERHDRTQFEHGVLDPYFIRHFLSRTYLQLTRPRVIAISTALANGPLARHDSILIPGIVDSRLLAMRAPSPASIHTTVAYVGSPKGKDDLSRLVDAVAQLDPATRNRLRIAIVGISADELVMLPGATRNAAAAASSIMQFHGRVSRDRVVDLLAEAHFSYLLRDPDAGYARYGFPSKVAESMAIGRPMITNETSDLATYLTDGEDALMIREYTAESVAEALLRAIDTVDSGKFERLSTNASLAATTIFSPSAVAKSISEWRK